MQLPFKATSSNTLDQCAHPTNPLFSHGKSFAENFGWADETFIHHHFDACLFLKDASANIYGDMLLSEYVLSIHSRSATTLSKRRKKHAPQNHNQENSLAESLIRLSNEEVHLFDCVQIQEFTASVPSLSVMQSNHQEIYSIICECNELPLKYLDWLIDLIKTRALLDSTDQIDVHHIYQVLEIVQYITEQIPKSNSPAGKQHPKKGSSVPKGKSGQLKAFVMALDKGVRYKETELQEIAENFSFEILLENWTATLDSLNQQGVILKCSKDEYKAL